MHTARTVLLALLVMTVGGWAYAHYTGQLGNWLGVCGVLPSVGCVVVIVVGALKGVRNES